MRKLKNSKIWDKLIIGNDNVINHLKIRYVTQITEY